MNGKIQVNSGDVSIIAVNVDGKPQDTIPTKEEGKYFESAECSNGAIGSWDSSNWRFLISNLTEKKTKCTLNFATGNVVGEQSGENKMKDLLNQESNKETLGTLVEDDYNNIRYIGINPSNYIYFNCKDSTTQNATNCETWRIIGLMDGIKTTSGKTERLLKIIRKDELSEDLCWDLSDSDVNNGNGVNEWSQADLMTLLNDDYFNAKTNSEHKCYNGDDSFDTPTTNCPDWTKEGLKQSARDMIEEVVWNTGGKYWPSKYMSYLYLGERSDNNEKICSATGYYARYCTDNVERKTTWTGKVGLMYSSDYGYATDGGADLMKRGRCLYTPLDDWDTVSTNNNYYCPRYDWLLMEIDEWTMTPAPNGATATEVFCVDRDGNISSVAASVGLIIRPVVYLKSSVKIIGGDGSETSPFQLKLDEN